MPPRENVIAEDVAQRGAVVRVRDLSFLFMKNQSSDR